MLIFSELLVFQGLLVKLDPNLLPLELQRFDFDHILSFFLGLVNNVPEAL
jgi:hypothetical protein